tara:strand:- start:164 stop:757 length:594 start_codon:yes stop_codon:yes gene_type:complete
METMKLELPIYEKQISNVFRYYPDKGEYYKNSGCSLEIWQENKLLSSIKPFNEIMYIDNVRNAMAPDKQKNTWLWLCFGNIIKEAGGKLYDERFSQYRGGDIPVSSREEEESEGVYEYRGQSYCVYYAKESRKYKLRFDVKDYRHRQISTHGALHKTIKECRSFAHKVIDELNLTDSQYKFEVIKHVSKMIKQGATL